jgi:hypothetical protein
MYAGPGRAVKWVCQASKGPVPLHPLLAEFMICWKRTTPYPKPLDWAFPSLRSKGKQPRVANMLVKDYLTASGREGWNFFFASG